MNETSFNDELIKNAIEDKEDSSMFIFLVMQENYVEVRNIDYATHSIGKLHRDTWVYLFKEFGEPLDDYLN